MTEAGIDLGGLIKLGVNGEVSDHLRLLLAIEALFMPVYAAGVMVHLGPALWNTARVCGLDTECLYFVMGWRGIAHLGAGILSVIGTGLNYRYLEILSHKQK